MPGGVRDLKPLGGTARQRHRGLAARHVDDPEIAPVDALAESGSERPSRMPPSPRSAWRSFPPLPALPSERRRSVSVKTRSRKRSPKRSSVRSMRRMSIRSVPVPTITPARSCDVHGAGPSRRVHQGPHARDRLVEPAENSLSDQKVADIELGKGGNASDGSDEVSKAIPCPAWHSRPSASAAAAASLDPRELRRRGIGTGLAEGAGMQLDHRRAERRCRFDLPWIRAL